MARGEFDESGTTIAPVFAEASNPVRKAVDFQKQLLSELDSNPDLFNSTHDIAEALRGMDRVTPYTKLLNALYASYDPKSNHEFRAWDLGKRIELMKAINSDALLKTSTDQWQRLERYNQLNAEIYDFVPDRLEPVVRPPKFFTLDGKEITLEDTRTLDKSQFVEVLSSGSHDLKDQSIFINTYMPTEEGKLIPTLHQGDVAASALVLHEGRHAFMDQMGRKADAFANQEFKDNYTILYMNTFGCYYLRGTNERNRLNPCEKDAYDFQRYMQTFLKASPSRRELIIRIIENEREAHLAQIPLQQSTYPQPALALAA